MVSWLKFVTYVFIAAIVILILCIHFPSILHACPVCYGGVETPLTKSMNLAILTLMGFTGVVFGGFIGFFIYLKKRGFH